MMISLDNEKKKEIRKHKEIKIIWEKLLEKSKELKADFNARTIKKLIENGIK